jgi:hypothetical protein
VLPSSVEIWPVSAENQCGEGGECLGAALTRRILPASKVMSTEDRRIRCVTRGQRESEWVAVIKASGICAHLLNRLDNSRPEVTLSIQRASPNSLQSPVNTYFINHK